MISPNKLVGVAFVFASLFLEAPTVSAQSVNQAQRQREVRAEFLHAWNGYKKYCWGHDDLKAQYIDQKKVAVRVGSTGRQGIIGWFVPQWMADKYPELNDQIRQRIKEGRWEIVGGMWVEPDLNIPDGESLVRQLLVGQRYFQTWTGSALPCGPGPQFFSGHYSALLWRICCSCWNRWENGAASCWAVR